MKNILFFLLSLFFYSVFGQNTDVDRNKIDALNYHFQIKINRNNDTIKAKATILLQSLTDSRYFSLYFASKNQDGKGMEVKKININGQKCDCFKQKNNQLLIDYPLHKKDTLSIEIIYQGIPSDGLIISKNKYGKKSFFGDNWPNRAHYWLPVIDHPSDKALVSFEIDAPLEMEVIASGKLIKRIKKEDRIRWFYKTDVPLATKVMVFGATSFNIKNYGIYHNIPVSGWVYQDSPENALDDYSVSMEILQYFDSLIGPYSYSKLANVQSKTRFGGMENAGNIFYYENSANGKANVENLVAHEIAHQWFGNSVTEKNWKDIWLSEGFATYLTDLYLERKYGKEKLEERMKMERNKVIRYNQYIKKPVVYEEKEDLMKLLNPNSYEKGAWVLHMLRKKIGDDNFFDLLRKYYANYRNKNASTEDFISLAEKISGESLQQFFDHWLYKAGVPELNITYSLKNKKLLVYIEQINDIYSLDFPIMIITDKEKKKEYFKVNQSKNLFSIPLKSTKNLKIILDPDTEILYHKTLNSQ